MAHELSAQERVGLGDPQFVIREPVKQKDVLPNFDHEVWAAGDSQNENAGGWEMSSLRNPVTLLCCCGLDFSRAGFLWGR